MNPTTKPRQELDRARASITYMLSAPTLGAFEEHWKEFLRRLERGWNKLSAQHKTDPKWNGWKSPFEHMRRTDPLISYLLNARGADEHSVQDITAAEGTSISINPAEGSGLHIERLVLSRNSLHVQSKQPVKIEFSPARISLLPVVNRGRTYNVPTEHNGAPIDSSNITAIAEIGLGYYLKAVSDAEKFFS